MSGRQQSPATAGGGPDGVGGRSLTPGGEVESRMGIQPLEELLAERDELVRQAAPLRALHGPFGGYDDARTVLLSTIAVAIRAQGIADGKKLTEEGIKQAAHADPRYMDFITRGLDEKARWFQLENAIQSVSDTIQRGNVIARYLSQEVGLSR